MIQIRQLGLQEIICYKNELVKYIFICLADNIPSVKYDYAEKYYKNMKHYIMDGSALVLGAFDDNDLIGFQWGYEVNELGAHRLHSSFVCVDPDFQGKKIGCRLMKFMEDIAKEKGVSAIEAMCSATNNNAVNYHLHNGFEIERYKVVKKLQEG